MTNHNKTQHYDDVIMGTIASQITSLTSVYSTVYSGADQSKHQSSASLAFVWGIHRGPVNSPHKWPVTRKMSPFDDVIMTKRKRSVPFNLNQSAFDCRLNEVRPCGHYQQETKPIEKQEMASKVTITLNQFPQPNCKCGRKHLWESIPQL